MMCKPKWLAGSLGSIYFIGYVLTLLWLPRLADVHGRKVLFTWGTFAQAILFTILMFTRQFYVMLVTIFAFGLLASIRQVTGFIYFLELMPQKNRTTAAVVFTIIDGLTYMLVTVYFWLISKQWFYIILIGYLMSIASAGLVWFLPESPVYLI